MRVYRPRRKRWSQRQLLAILDQSSGSCHWCGVKIRGGEPWTPDHVKRLADGGADDLSNLRAIHRRCHDAKTAKEASRAAKADTIAAKHWGIKPTAARHPFPGSKASGWKKRMDGTVERRR
jgi:5-methylcytosine-specific restriction enzyme A